MKKLVLLLAVAFSASLYSCGSSDKAAEATDTVAVEEVAVEEVAVVDTLAADTTAAAADTTATVAE